MITREELLKSSEYWIEVIQNKVYNDLIAYIESKNITNKELAKMLDVSKGRVSQILSGENLNFRLDTLIKLCLAIEKVPEIRLTDMEKYISADRKEPIPVIFKDSNICDYPLFNVYDYVPDRQSEFYKVKMGEIVTTVETRYSDEKVSSINEKKAA